MSAESHAMKTWFEIILPQQYESLTTFLESGYQYAGIPDESIHSAASYGANAVFSSWVVCLGLIGCALLAKVSLSKAMSRKGVEGYYADSSLSLRNIMEVYVSFIRDLSNSLLPKKDTSVRTPSLATTMSCLELRKTSNRKEVLDSPRSFCLCLRLGYSACITFTWATSRMDCLRFAR
jgi:hypothetical protein